MGTRRPIVDRTGRLVALDEERYRLWLHPRYFNLPGDEPTLIRPPADVAARLAPLLPMSEEEILQRMGDRPSGIKLMEGLDPETAATIRAEGISGVDLESYPHRVYPQGELFANVVGFLNQDREPQAGLEQSRHQDLQRHEQARSLRRGADGTPLPDNLDAGVFFGDDLRLQLTLDARLQALAAKALADQVKTWKAQKGVAIVMDVGGWPINNHDKKAHGLVDFATVLQVSSNVGMVQAMRRLDDDAYWNWMERLGINQRPDTDLPGAVAGQLKSKKQFTTQPIEPATTAFGQGFSLTPLKLVQLHGMLANGGKLISPHITRGFRSGDALAPAAAPSGQQLLNPEVTRTVLQWMESVVDQGSGKGVKTPGYRIGGKTGTAQKALNGIYLPGAKICSFVATLPIEDPRYVVFVVVDEPQGEHAYGSTVAVPVAKQIIDALLVVERIAPSKPAELNKLLNS